MCIVRLMRVSTTRILSGAGAWLEDTWNREMTEDFRQKRNFTPAWHFFNANNDSHASGQLAAESYSSSVVILEAGLVHHPEGGLIWQLLNKNKKLIKN